MVGKIWTGCVVLSTMVLLSACGESAADKAYTHLEESVTLEQEFEEQQQPLMEAEEEEYKIYEQILTLSLSDMEKIEALTNEALQLVDERQERIEAEKESIEASYQEFQLARETFNKIEEDAQAKGQELTETMEQRYESYQRLYEQYSEAIELDRKLYTLLQQEDLSMEELEEHIDQINEKYHDIVTNKNEFNQLTDKYNEKKAAFYEAIGIEVQEGSSESNE